MAVTLHGKERHSRGLLLVVFVALIARVPHSPRGFLLPKNPHRSLAQNPADSLAGLAWFAVMGAQEAAKEDRISHFNITHSD